MRADIDCRQFELDERAMCPCDPRPITAREPVCMFPTQPAAMLGADAQTACARWMQCARDGKLSTPQTCRCVPPSVVPLPSRSDQGIYAHPFQERSSIAPL